MTRPTRAQLAPIVYLLGVGAVATAALASLPPDSRTWWMDHAEAAGLAIMTIAGGVGRVVARLPHFGTSPRTIEAHQSRVHQQVDALVETLAVIQAELDMLANKLIHTRQKMPPNGGG